SLFAGGNGRGGGAGEKAIRAGSRKTQSSRSVRAWVRNIEIPMAYDPVGTETVDTGGLQMEAVDRRGGHALSVRRQVHRAAWCSPRRCAPGRRAAVFRQTINFGCQVERRGTAIVVHLSKIAIEAAIFFGQKDDVLDHIHIGRRRGGRRGARAAGRAAPPRRGGDQRQRA